MDNKLRYLVLDSERYDVQLIAAWLFVEGSLFFNPVNVTVTRLRFPCRTHEQFVRLICFFRDFRKPPLSNTGASLTTTKKG